MVPQDITSIMVAGPNTATRFLSDKYTRIPNCNHLIRDAAQFELCRGVEVTRAYQEEILLISLATHVTVFGVIVLVVVSMNQVDSYRHLTEYLQIMGVTFSAVISNHAMCQKD